MSLFASFRSEQMLSQLIAEPDPSSAGARKLVERLKKAGNKAIPKIIDALALSDKSHMMVLVDILSALVNDKNLHLYREGLADGNERVVSGTAWALSSSTDYNANALLDFFDDDEVSKAALIEVLRVHKQDLSVHELLQRAYDCEPNEKAAIFKIIEDAIKPDMVPDLIARMGGKDPVIKIHLMNLLTKFEQDKTKYGHHMDSFNRSLKTVTRQGQVLLNTMSDDRLAELLALLGIAQRGIVAVHSCTDHSPGNAVTGFG